MSQEDQSRLAVYLKLVDRAEAQSFWSSVEGIETTGFTVSLVQAVLEAIEHNLSSHVIKTAVQIGEHRGRNKKASPPPETIPASPYNLEAETFFGEYFALVWITEDDLLAVSLEYANEIENLGNAEMMGLLAELSEKMKRIVLAALPAVIEAILRGK